MMPTLLDLINEARRLYYSGETIKDVTQKVMTPELPNDDLGIVLFAGFHDLIRDAIRSDRVGHTKNVGDNPLRPAIQFAPHRAQGAAGYHILARVHYEGADGKPKALLDFTAADCQLRVGAEARLAAGAKRRADFFTSAFVALEGEGKGKVGALAKATLERLNSEADEAFGRADIIRGTDVHRGPSDDSGRAS